MHLVDHAPPKLVADLSNDTCVLSSLVLNVNGGMQGKVNARCCHRLVTSASFTAKVAAWTTAYSKSIWTPADHS